MQYGFEEPGDVQDIRLVVDTIPTLAWSARPDGSAEFFNQRWLDYTGLSAEQALGSGWQVAIHPDDLPRILETFREALNSVKPYEVEGRFRRFNGEFRWFLFRGSPLRDRSGKVAKWYGTNTDLEERKRAEEALRKSEERWRSVFENSAIGVALTDLNARYLVTNHVYQTIVGYTEEELRTLDFLSVTHEDYREANWALITELVEGKRRQFQIEKKYRRKDGSLVWVSNNVSLVPGTERAPRFIMALSEDITQRKRAEEKLRRSEADLLEAQRLSHTGSLKHDIASGRVTVSPEVYRIYGVRPDEAESNAEFWLNRTHPEDAKRIQELFEECEIQKTDYEADHRIVLPDGAVKHLHAIGHPLVNEEGDLVEFFGTVMDVTTAKQAEEKIRQSESELRQILELAPQHVYVLWSDPDPTHLYANPAALDYLGLTFEEWRTYDRRRLCHPDDWERVMSEAQGKFSSGLLHETQLHALRNDGKYRWFLLRWTPIRDEQGRLTRWYAAATDIEERKQTEQRLRNENVALREEIDKASMFEQIVGTSVPLQMVLARISKVAPTDSSVLITGETGTGKELVARAIHRRSQRSSRAFVSVNCAAIPRDLIASELFGHEKGAFTGATQRRLGRFELAEGGTIFLDEIGELPAETQIALLRVLQEHEFERVGGAGSMRTNVRVIAATNRDLEAGIAAGVFRSDLFYRLNVFPIEVPPLRERRQDIPVLVEYFIDRYARKAGKSFQAVNKKSLDLLQSYSWPGNIRELQNVIERSVIVCETETFSVDESWLSRRPSATEPKVQVDFSEKLAAQEKEMIEAALRETKGRVFGPSGAAAKLGMPGTTLDSKIKSLKISKNRFKTA